MDKAKYKRLISELYGLMDKKALEEALVEKRTPVRVDAVQDLMRTAVMKSSVSMFNGVPYYFGGKVYEPMTFDDFGSLVYDLMRKCRLPNGDYSRIESIIKVLRRVVSVKSLRLDSAVVVFNNCVLDLKTKTTHQFNRRFVQVTSMPYDYNPKEHVFVWKQFLDEVLPNKRWQSVFQEFLGSIFIDRKVAKMETMLILRGAGSNGKSVVFETTVGILGRDNVSNFGLGELIGGSERKKNMASINGKRLNYCSEIKAMEIGSGSGGDILKGLISGEPTEARPMYGDNFTAYDIPLLMANANQLPFLKDWSYGMRRRLCIIPFEVEIPRARQRKSLARDLEYEYPAIFNWIMEGRDRFIANGYKLTEDKALETVLDDYQAESSTVMKFMYERRYYCRYEDIDDVEPKWILASHLYNKYRGWCRDKGVGEENVSVFGRILTTAGYRKKRSPDGIVYAVFGEVVTNMLRRERQAEQEASEEVDITKPIYKDGRRYAYTYEGLASCIAMSYVKIKAMMDKGELEGTYYMEKRRTVFDIDKVLAYLRDKREREEREREVERQAELSEDNYWNPEDF